MLRTLSRSVGVVHRRASTQVSSQAKLSSSVFARCDARETTFRAHQLGVSTVWQRSAILPPDSHIPRKPNSARIDEEPPLTGLMDYADAGFAVFKEYESEEEPGKIDDEIKWRRNKRYDGLAKELVELYDELDECIEKVDKEGRVSGQESESGRVKHLGHQVYVQNNLYALDRDAMKHSPVTITRPESRSVVEHALSVLKYDDAVCVTGQPGIGKTRGSMMRALQVLLHRQAAVLYVGYKNYRMVLFLPDENGNYRTWTSSSEGFVRSVFHQDKRVVALIDPPEKGAYLDAGVCRILKFASNNYLKHFENWEKDGTLLVTSIPSEEEVLAMTEVLWSDKTTPFANEDFEDKRELVEHRIRIVGPIPRLVFNGEKYRAAVRDGAQRAHKVRNELNPAELYSALKGTYSPLLEKHAAAAASGVLFLNASRNACLNEKERRPLNSRQQLTPVATRMLQEDLKAAVKKLEKEQFEEYAFHRMCAELKCRGVTEKDKQGTAVKKIKTQSESDNVLYRTTVCNFVFVDFSRSSTHWYNAKSGENPTVLLGGAFRFLKEMGLVKRRGDNVPGWIATEEGEHFRGRLTLVTKNDAKHVIQHDPNSSKHGTKKEQKQLFERLVTVDTINICEEEVLDSELKDAIEQELAVIGFNVRMEQTSERSSDKSSGSEQADCTQSNTLLN